MRKMKDRKNEIVVCCFQTAKISVEGRVRSYASLLLSLVSLMFADMRGRALFTDSPN